ncbi:CPW-WPC family protein, putative [Babesia ovis]|uniref:CPW-WPC family protein, putative n=1 Tax=Babesia ovis TaxID=5869 RepID=A0A9W5TEI9_BABOV|nr:CPW-WPC family protein, putative [Babesia ovis]
MCVIWLPWLYFTAAAALSADGTVLHEAIMREASRRYTAAGTTLTTEEINHRVNKSLEKASELLGLQVPKTQDGCEIDFSAFCPDGWVPTGDGIHCVLPNGAHTNTGLCGRALDMSDKSALDRLNLSEMCDLKWPCLKQDVVIPKEQGVCPRYWIKSGDECIADGTYTGPCNTTFKHSGQSPEELKQQIKACRLPFSKTCHILDEASDWSADCPLGWSLEDDNVCTQNSDQNMGTCGNKMKFGSINDKRQKAKLCNLVWPIKADTVESQCPLGWRQDAATGLCLAPASYTGPCQLRMDFSKYSTHDKAIWAHACGTSFWEPGTAAGAHIVTAGPRSDPDIFYRNGPVDEALSVVRFDKKVQDAGIMERQLEELEKLRKKSSDPSFLKTLARSIHTLREHIKKIGSTTPSFIQITTKVPTNEHRKCPYGWRQFDTVCVASETYGKVVPGCNIVQQMDQEYDKRCRADMTNDNHNDDFVRAYCPIGWRTRQIYFESLIRHVCVAPETYTEAQKAECGGTTVDFSARSPGFKRRWAYACGQRFPDFDDEHINKCVENFYWKCPSEWQQTDKGCEAPSHYEGPCPKSVTYSQLGTDSAKAAFSKKCRAAWPCIGTCQKDYSGDCPQGWNRLGASCVAPLPGSAQPVPQGITHVGNSICGPRIDIVK